MKRSYLGIVLAAAAVAACDDSTGPEGPIDVTVDFAALVNGTTVACGQSFPGVGTSNSEISIQDFRFYVHDVQLLKADGSSEALQLEQDGLWQNQNLALLDFEDATGDCSGTPATNTSVRGTVPAGDYTGLRFTLGVPMTMNHQLAASADPPQDLDHLWWSWNGGYKFVRMDHLSSEPSGGWNVHLGSTGCTPSGDASVPATSCTNEHRSTITFDVFDWETNEVVADYGVLLEDSDISTNAMVGSPPAASPRGCMSFPNDPDCHEVMNNLGLDYEGSVSTGQKFFSVR